MTCYPDQKIYKIYIRIGN